MKSKNLFYMGIVFFLAVLIGTLPFGCINDYSYALEICDGIDNDSDGQIDEGVCNIYYKDDDNDGQGVNGDSRCLCSPDEISKYTARYSGDPDDLDPNIQGALLTGNINLPDGWSMISLPLNPQIALVSDLFPKAEVIYGYDKVTGYVRKTVNEEMEFGKGYWILLNEPKTFSMTGWEIKEYKFFAQDGWYMIGGCTSEAQASGINCDINVIYGHEQCVGYKHIHGSEYLKPGKGYWIKIEDAVGQSELKVSSQKVEEDYAGNILFISNGHFQQEANIYSHLVNLDYTVTVMAGYKISSTTDLTPYDLIIVTGFDKTLVWYEIDSIKDSGIPILIVEYGDFWYSYLLELVKWPIGYNDDTDTVELTNNEHIITSGLDSTFQIYQSCTPPCPWDPFSIYATSIDINSLEDGILPLIFSQPGTNKVTLIVNDERKAVATGIYDTKYYTDEAWELFDRILGYLKPIQVEIDWAYKPTDVPPFVSTVPRPGGGILANTQRGDVYGIDINGNTSILYTGSDIPPYSRAILNSTGNTFIIVSENTFSLYNANGILLGTQPVGFRYILKPVPLSEMVFFPEISAYIAGDGEEGATILSGRIIDSSGAVHATFPAHGLKLYRLTSTHVFHATRDEFVKTSISGTENWRLSLMVEKFEVSDNSHMTIVNSGLDTRNVLHFNDNIQISDTPLGSVVWNIAVSPDGKYSVATTKTDAHIFIDGILYRSVSLPIAYAISADVSDLGEVIVGGKNSDRTSHLLLLNKWGQILWEEEDSVIDNTAWRPDVQFTPDGNTIIVRDKSGLTSYSIERGL